MKENKEVKSALFEKREISREELSRRIEAKLVTVGITEKTSVSDSSLYLATTLVIKDLLLERRESFLRRGRRNKQKKIYYLCMEFLVGRSLISDSENMGISTLLSDILSEYGTTLERISAEEADPGLGNGGLGRLAACFMDSLTALDYACDGFSLLYENGLFKQKIIDGEQVELPDKWLSASGCRLVPRSDKAVRVRLGGRIEENFTESGIRISAYDYDEVLAVPYDLLIPGTDTDAVNVLRLWRARGVGTESRDPTHGGYIRELSEGGAVETLTKQLYPDDNYDSGKLLRLTQQYLLVSASLQSIINDYLSENGSLDGFGEKVAIHINDTHPALCIPELMRILMDVYSYGWERAWQVVTMTVSYTNHTVLPEALEVWRSDLFSVRLPRIYMIIKEINRRFTEELWKKYPGDWDRISRMSPLAYNQVRMANLSVIGSHKVNGVSRLHSEILKKTVFSDFYRDTPEKFTSVTNGISHRRWLLYSNPELSSFIDSLIGEDYRKNTLLLKDLLRYKDSSAVLSELCEIKLTKKRQFSDYIKARSGDIIDPDTVFDVQIKRMHEYKRQLLNLLKIISEYNELCDSPDMHFLPKTYIFGCKAASGYAIAKKIIKLINCLSKEISENPLCKDKLKVLFVEDYGVSVAEKLIPSAEISEQISLAGKEASGTGCMKLMMNGALTIGTLDGANVEIKEACGEENIYIFGLDSGEVELLWRSGYSSSHYLHSSERLRRCIERLYKPIGGEDFSSVADYLVNSERGVADPFMCLADFESYLSRSKAMYSDYEDRAGFARKSLINIATSGVFSSDVSVKKYAEDIWEAKPVGKYRV